MMTNGRLNITNVLLSHLNQVYVIGLGVSIVKKRQSVVDEQLDSSDDSDEEMLSA